MMCSRRYHGSKRGEPLFHKKEKKKIHPACIAVAGIQLVISALFFVLLWRGGLLPAGYMAAAALVLLLLQTVTVGLQLVGSRGWLAGCVLALFVSAALGLGAAYLYRADRLLADVGGADYKTDSMAVVVRSEDPAQILADVKNYRFGTQNVLDQENTSRMLEDVKDNIGREPNVTEYGSVQEMARALLDGSVNALIYNQAFDTVIGESIEGYSDQVRVLYQYGINTPIENEEADVKQPFNIYISGIDVSGDIATNSRSDVNIIMTVNPETKEILLTTTPRDYYVQLPGVSGESRDKLTHAGIYGVDVSMAALEALYGIDITYYARVNFTSLITIVDALGGIDVQSEHAFEAGGYQFVRGSNHLDGEQALAFSRERYSFESGDNQRGRNQEAVLTAILQKAMSPAILKNADQILAGVSQSVQTNMTREEMAEFIRIQIADPSGWSIEAVAAAGTGDMQSCFSSGSQLLYVMRPDEASVSGITERMRQVLE